MEVKRQMEEQGLRYERELGTLRICHGKPRCTATRKEKRDDTCPWCYEMSIHDTRSDMQIAKDMDRTH
jgi:hypothetical protein